MNIKVVLLDTAKCDLGAAKCSITDFMLKLFFTWNSQ